MTKRGREGRLRSLRCLIACARLMLLVSGRVLDPEVRKKLRAAMTLMLKGRLHGGAWGAFLACTFLATLDTPFVCVSGDAAEDGDMRPQNADDSSDDGDMPQLCEGEACVPSCRALCLPKLVPAKFFPKSQILKIRVVNV